MTAQRNDPTLRDALLVTFVLLSSFACIAGIEWIVFNAEKVDKAVEHFMRSLI